MLYCDVVVNGARGRYGVLSSLHSQNKHVCSAALTALSKFPPEDHQSDCLPAQVSTQPSHPMTTHFIIPCRLSLSWDLHYQTHHMTSHMILML